MKYQAIALLLMAGTATAFGQGGYEQPPRFTPEQALPGVAEKAALYEFGHDVLNDGMMNNFYIFAGPDTYVVEGNELALERLHEVDAINQLEQMKTSDSFAEGMKKAGGKTIDSVKTIVTHPVQTASAIPKGVKRFFGNAYRATQREGQSNYEDATYKEIIGFSKVKRQLASHLKVDVYTSNERLQKLLDDVSWSSYAGGASLSVLTAVVVPAPISTAATITKTSVDVSKMLESESPENLWTINKKRLEEIGATEMQMESLRKNVWFSPRRQTVFVDALYTMKDVKGIAAYIDRADDAASEEEAFFMQRGAEMLAAIHKGHTPLVALHMAGALPLAETKEGKLVAAFAVDYLTWSERVDAASSAMRSELPAKLGDAEMTLWLLGGASEKLKSELSHRGITVEEHAGKKLFPPANAA